MVVMLMDTSGDLQICFLVRVYMSVYEVHHYHDYAFDEIDLQICHIGSHIIYNMPSGWNHIDGPRYFQLAPCAPHLLAHIWADTLHKLHKLDKYTGIFKIIYSFNSVCLYETILHILNI